MGQILIASKDREWYAEQTARWEALHTQGWEFVAPPSYAGHVGLRMMRTARTHDDDTADIYTPARQPFRDVHTSLLMQCESYAEMFAAGD